jgi:hypothetical protein
MRATSLLAIAVVAAGLLPGAAPVRAQDPVARRAPALVAIEAGARPVALESATMRVDVGAGRAQTTLEMTFSNPNARVLEGNLQFPLRPGQQVLGFALDVDGRMREAVPVEKARGRQVFEAIERRGADPGLLEQAAGDFFRLRIYPFPAHGTRAVRLTLAEPLRSGAAPTMTLPLQFASDLSALDIEFHGPAAPEVRGLLRQVALTSTRRGHWTLTLSRGDFLPARGLTLAWPATSRPAVQVQSFRGERYFVADVPLADAPRRRQLPPRIGLLWDSSLSGAKRAHDLEYALLEAYFLAAGTVDVSLLRLRDAAEPVQRFHVQDGNWAALRAALEATQYDGATAAGGWTPEAAIGEYLLFGDGLFDYGNAPFPTFGAHQRLYAIRAGVAGDSMRLAGLAAARGGRALSLDDSGDLAAATTALLEDGPRLIAIDGVGASDLLAESPDPVDGTLRIAGRLREAAARLHLDVDTGSGPRDITVDLASAVEGDLAANTWARYQLAQLQQEPDTNRAAIAKLGTDFHLVTPQTSLIVLERAEDYLRYHITPPAELAAAYAPLARAAADEAEVAQGKQMESVREQWQARVAWWSRPFPKTAPPATPKQAPARAPSAARQDVPSPMTLPPPPAAPSAVVDESNNLDRIQVTGARIDSADAAAAESDSDGDGTTRIALQPWRPDSPAARRLRLAGADAVYAVYLDERMRAPSGSAFYLDAADVLFEKGQPALALRVLSNLAELDLDNRQVLRVLAYRLLQAGKPALAVPVLEQVLAMASDEPQSYRDLALACAALGQRQRAIELLYEIVTGQWDGRFPGIETTALAELNAIVASAPQPLDTHAMDAALLRNLPLGLRAVLSWDADDTDIDLWVTDPNGERAYYAHPATYQGGRMSPDFTGGYGPEEFALRTPKPGTYKVEANYFGDRQQVLTGSTTLQLWLSTGFGTRSQHDEAVVLRLRGKDDTVFVGEFQVK